MRYDLDALRQAVDRDALARREADLWRWRELLPVREARHVVSLGEAETPLVSVPAASGGRAGVVQGRRPPAHRLVQGARPRARRLDGEGARRRAHRHPTNGNAGAALAAYATRAGIETVILCPDDTPEINVHEIAAYGGRVYRVNGLIDECESIVAQGAAEGRWFDASTLKEPYRIEGKKTMGLELALALQLGWTLPDLIFYPTGGGTGLIGMWKAFDELEALGWIGPARPRMIAVQASGCAPIVRAFEAGEEHAPRWEDAHTVAAGIRVPKAVGDFLILRAVRESGSRAVAVDDAAIVEATQDAARRDGFLICPEGGATLAAYCAARAGWAGTSASCSAPSARSTRSPTPAAASTARSPSTSARCSRGRNVPRARGGAPQSSRCSRRKVATMLG